jgi:hypothetical protein
LRIDSTMTITSYLKPVLGALVVVALGAGYYWLEHRPRPQESVVPNKALVVVAKAVNACFSDLVRVTGFVVPRKEAVVGVDQEGSKVTDLLVREGDIVTDKPAESRREAGAGIAARTGGRTRDPRQHHRRRAGIPAGRADVSNCRQQ